ncbi:hypothetical protein BDW66DRAFT_129474 [Aspergillus desertorum]
MLLTSFPPTRPYTPPGLIPALSLSHNTADRSSRKPSSASTRRKDRHISTHPSLLTARVFFILSDNEKPKPEPNSEPGEMPIIRL